MQRIDGIDEAKNYILFSKNQRQEHARYVLIEKKFYKN